MRFKKIVRLFESGGVSVFGTMGSGKDVLTGNVIARRKEPYISNMDYGYEHIPLDFEVLSFGGNTYKNFISRKVNYFKWPYRDKIDVYLSDSGILLPAQYSNQLDKEYPYLTVSPALIRQIADGRFHTNTQALSRTWNKFREQADFFLLCNWICKPLIRRFGIVLQRVTIYERYESAEKKVPPFPLAKPLLNRERQFQWEIQYTNYLIAHGAIRSGLLLYRNKSKHNSRFFKELMENGIKKEDNSPDLCPGSPGKQSAGASGRRG